MADALLFVIIDSSQKTVIISAASITTVLSANWKLVLLAGLQAAPVNSKVRFNSYIDLAELLPNATECFQSCLSVHSGDTSPASRRGPAPLNLFS